MIKPVLDILLDDDALLALVDQDSILPMKRDQGMPLPGVVLECPLIDPNDTKDTTSKMDVGLVFVHCFAETYQACNLIAETVRTAVDGYSGVINAVYVELIRFKTSHDSHFNDNQEVFQISVELDVMIKRVGSAPPPSIDADPNQYWGTDADGNWGMHDLVIPELDPPVIRAIQFLGSEIKCMPLRGDIGDITTSSTLLDQSIHYTAIMVHRDMPLQGLQWWKNVNGVFTPNDFNGIGFYSFLNGVLTLIASSPNTPALWTTGASVWQSQLFSAPVDVTEGVYYAAALRCSTAAGTAPTLGAFGNMLSANIALDFDNSAFLGAVGSGTSLPATVNASALTKVMNPIALFPY